MGGNGLQRVVWTRLTSSEAGFIVHKDQWLSLAALCHPQSVRCSGSGFFSCGAFVRCKPFWLKPFLVQDVAEAPGSQRCFFFRLVMPRRGWTSVDVLEGVVEGDLGSPPSFEPVAQIRQEDGAQVVSHSRGRRSSRSSRRSSSTSVERSRQRRSGPSVEVGSRYLCSRRGRLCSVEALQRAWIGTGAWTRSLSHEPRSVSRKCATLHWRRFATKKPSSKMEFLVLQLFKRRPGGQTSQIFVPPTAPATVGGREENRPKDENIGEPFSRFDDHRPGVGIINGCPGEWTWSQ